MSVTFLLVLTATLFGCLATVNAANATDVSKRTDHGRYLQDSYDTNFQVNMLEAVNELRKNCNLPLLCMNAQLQEVAQRHAEDMAAHGFMDHVGSDGLTYSDRISNAGYDPICDGENVAAGQFTVQEVVKEWDMSKVHHDNLLNINFTMFRCGYAYNENSYNNHYWAQEFGTSQTQQCLTDTYA